MNIYEEIKNVNSKHNNRIALGFRKSNGETVRYTYKKMFEYIELCCNNLQKLGFIE